MQQGDPPGWASDILIQLEKLSKTTQRVEDVVCGPRENPGTGLIVRMDNIEKDIKGARTIGWTAILGAAAAVGTWIVSHLTSGGKQP